MPSSIHFRAYAKINWTLDVLFKREDGYHELRTIYQTVSLHDLIRLTETSGAIEIVCDDPQVPSDETNLAHRAATQFRDLTGTKLGARIEIEKRIPVAAGLGGGSSNAAAVLLGLSRLWNVQPDEHELVKIAAGLGSDVPFFLIGGTALGVGRGEEVYSIEQAECEHLLLVNPGFEVSTAEAYGKLPRLTSQRSAAMMPFTFFAAKGIRGLSLAVTNDLEEVVLAAHPEITEVKQRLLSLGARLALMSGSGATVFGVFENVEMSRRAQSEMRATGYWSEPARAVSRREYSETLFQ
ncbi:MAG: 4-(cytidine 5'-diphospho)-2-C-methyl-D-erythritol kinase [Acidobacteriota bacterium]